MRSSHFHLDSVSKMKVKLAVQVLNEKVHKDMKAFDPVSTESTQLIYKRPDRIYSMIALRALVTPLVRVEMLCLISKQIIPFHTL